MPMSLGDLWDRSLRDPEGFWQSVAGELYWRRRWERPLDGENPPFYRWFVGGETNMAYNALDRHVEGGRGNRAALIWVGSNGESRVLRYYDLYSLTNRMARVLSDMGLGRGDRVVIYMPMVPEAAAAMLAVARLGAVHSVVFSGFGVQALAERIRDADAGLVITADAMYRRGKVIRLKDIVDEAVARVGRPVKALVYRRVGTDVRMGPNDRWLHEELERVGRRAYVPPTWVRSEEPLFILYTSGTTGRPKGITHLHGQYMVWAYAHVKWLFGFGPNDVFFSLPDIGWINGHSYSTYGPLLNGATVLWYEDAPDHPDPGVWWRIVDEYAATHMWVAPTAVRLLMKYGPEWPQRYDLSSLRLVVSAGEILGVEAWRWLNENVCRGRQDCHVIETWGQTENSGFITAPGGLGLDGIQYRLGSVGKPYPGIVVEVLDDEGRRAEPRRKGHVAIRPPVPPAFMYTVWGDPDRYVKAYWSRFPGYYYTGDYGYMDEEGYLYILGRADDVVKVAGHRLGPAEIENAVASHPAVAEAAVVSTSDPVRGEALAIFVVPKAGTSVGPDEVREHVRRELGPVAVVSGVYIVDRLPRTRTGKIMRRVLRAVLEGGDVGDLTTLEDEASVEEVQRAVAELRASLGRG